MKFFYLKLTTKSYLILWLEAPAVASTVSYDEKNNLSKGTENFALLQGSSSFATIRIIILSNGALKAYPYGDAAVSGAGNMQGTFTYVI